jgi:DNA-binding transcriptional LysR family regulator
MQLKHLRTFVAVARTLNVTQASERLHLSQSSVTEQIQSLEIELGTLFDRSRRAWRLTPAGERLLDYAEDIISLTEEAKAAVTQRANEVTGRVVVGGVETLCTQRLPSLIREYCTTHPSVQTTLRAGKTVDLHGGLREGSIDIYFTFGELAEEPGLKTEKVGREPILLVGPSDHRLRGRPDLGAEDLVNEDFAITIVGCPVRAAFEQAFAKCSMRPRIVAETSSIAAIRRFVEDGPMCAMMPASAAREAIDDGKLVPLEWPLKPMDISMRWRRTRFTPAPLAAFLELARNGLR